MSRSRDESIGFAIGVFRMTVNQTSKLTNLTEFFPSVRLIHIPIPASWNDWRDSRAISYDRSGYGREWNNSKQRKLEKYPRQRTLHSIEPIRRQKKRTKYEVEVIFSLTSSRRITSTCSRFWYSSHSSLYFSISSLVCLIFFLSTSRRVPCTCVDMLLDIRACYRLLTCKYRDYESGARIEVMLER